jgi:hypothetical protein
VDLRPVGLLIEPDKTDSLLEDAFTPVMLKFDTEMEKNDAEGVLQVNSDSGTVNGDRYWVKNDLYFVPVAGWTAGVRYTLSLSGTIRTVDGRELRLERHVSFYAINRNEMPVLERISPKDGASIGTGDFVMEFNFSLPMDRLSVETSLTIDGTGNKIFEWQDDKSLKIYFDKALNPWSQYKWNIKDNAKSIDGVPLARSYSGYFFTDVDKTLPKVEKIYPVLSTDGLWYPTGMELESGLEAGHGIAVEFNKVMGENALRSVRFEPSLSGRIELLSENSIVYIFSRNPEPETNYTLIVSGDTRDSEGLKIGADYRVNFIPNIPFLNVLSVGINDESYFIDDISSHNVLQIDIDSVKSEFYFTIRFSLPFNDEDKHNSVYRISLSPFFPGSLPPVALNYVYWVSDDRLSMCWEGLKNGSSEMPNYYKLTIPGGKGGINIDGVMYMKKDITVYLEAY